MRSKPKEFSVFGTPVEVCTCISEGAPAIELIVHLEEGYVTTWRIFNGHDGRTHRDRAFELINDRTITNYVTAVWQDMPPEAHREIDAFITQNRLH